MSMFASLMAVRQPKEDGLIIHLDGTNNTGVGHSDTSNRWVDLSGNQYAVEFKKTPVWQEDGLVFDGAQSVALPMRPEFRNNGAVSVVVDFTIASWPESSARIVRNIPPGGSNYTTGYTLDLDSSRNISFRVGDGTSEGSKFATAYGLSLDKKYKSVMTFGADKKTYVRLNGVLSVSSSVLSGSPYATNTRTYLGSTNGTGSFFNGIIHQFKFYNRVLTQAEIDAHMNGG